MELLQVVGLIAKTRQGKVLEGKGICTLYQLTWRNLDPSDKYDNPIIMPRPPSNDWAAWKRPDDWEALLRKSKRKAQGKTQQPEPLETAARIAQLRRDENCSVLTSGPSGGRVGTTVWTVSSNLPVHTGEHLLDFARGRLIELEL